MTPFGEVRTESGWTGVSRGVAEIDGTAIVSNCRTLRRRLERHSKLCAVVKADGYGHGANKVANAALDGGATHLAVSTAGEATSLRDRFPRTPVLAMGALAPVELEQALSCGSEVSCSSRGYLDLIAARARAAGARARVHVKLDTGMGRMGTSDCEELLETARACAKDPNLDLVGAWTHFATADDLSSSLFGDQLRLFTGAAERLRLEFPHLTLHAANSAAVFRDRAAHLDMARCGIAIYGLDPFQRDPARLDLVPAMVLRSYLAQVKSIPAGGGVGYGASWRAPCQTFVGLVPLGYGDGVRRALSGLGEVLIAGMRRPMVGRISMDSLTVDLGPDSPFEVGDEVVLIGSRAEERILVEDLAEKASTINYDIICGITGRVPRRFVPFTGARDAGRSRRTTVLGGIPSSDDDATLVNDEGP